LKEKKTKQLYVPTILNHVPGETSDFGGKMKRTVLILSVVVFLFGCVNPEINKIRTMTIMDVNASGITDGKYPGSFTYGGFEYKIETEVAAGRITSIVMRSNRNTKHAKMAEGVIPKIIARQTPNVDAVSGATNSSRVIMNAAQDAIEKSYGNLLK
jgi:uncharacterized protein with FMN-binding domain